MRIGTVLKSVGLIVVGGAVAAVAVNVGSPRKAEAQTTVKMLIMTGGQAPINSISVGRMGATEMQLPLGVGFHVVVSGTASNAVYWTCAIKFQSLDNAIQFTETLRSDKTAQLDCRGPLNPISTSNKKWRDEDFTKDEVWINSR